MCTVTWLHTLSGYQLLCNRDERRTRQPALTPMVRSPSGVRFIAPIDDHRGGAWIGVNEAGLAFGLVNRYVCSRCNPRNNRQAPSRGLLVMALADCRSLEEAQVRFNHLDLAPYPPFAIVLLAPFKPSVLLHWTGRDSWIECNGDSAMPLVSSSVDPRGIEVYRKRLFQTLAAARGCVDEALLMDFHASHSPIASAYSPCMHRENAHTVSFSRVTVSEDVIEFAHFPRALCARRKVADRIELNPAWKLIRMRMTHPSRAVNAAISGNACAAAMSGR